MIRFIDLRDQDIDYKFAFWDTTDDCFISTQSSAWNTWVEFESQAQGYKINIPRFMKLLPTWVDLYFDSPVFGKSKNATDEELNYIENLIEEMPVAVFQIFNKSLNKKKMLISIEHIS